MLYSLMSTICLLVIQEDLYRSIQTQLLSSWNVQPKWRGSFSCDLIHLYIGQNIMKMWGKYHSESRLSRSHKPFKSYEVVIWIKRLPPFSLLHLLKARHLAGLLLHPKPANTTRWATSTHTRITGHSLSVPWPLRLQWPSPPFQFSHHSSSHSLILGHPPPEAGR